MKKIAVLYSGCGHKDGAEVTEVVSVLANLDLAKAKVTCFSLNKDVPVTNHLTQTTSKTETRNMLVEAARISRGQIQELNSLVVSDFDALVIAGGFGTALHFCNWASMGIECTVDTDVNRAILDFHKAEKPIAAVCIAPILLAKCLAGKGITITLGPKSDNFNQLKRWDVDVVECPVNDFITDRDNKIITTPAFMHNTSFGPVFNGIGNMIKELVEMA
ncbi:MAG: isoprenoid biosynthesis glyoxalase ElbB [Bdellovibrionaceae bacterium]|nr:isoprenoid biosynthesis glyoxalase ElbB [Pseudobdellovibrionaceae bacterium]